MSIAQLQTLDHHSYILLGDKDQSLLELKNKLTELGIAVAGNPDLRLEEFDQFLVEDSRKLFFWQSQKPLQSNKNIFILTVRDMTPEAQNALLKFFEEPSTDSIFFLIMTGEDKLLETLRSRCLVLHCGEGQESEVERFATEFLQADKPERLKLIDKQATLFRKHDKPQAREFRFLLEAIERQLKTMIGNRLFTEDEVLAFDRILEAKDQLRLPASASKNIFEHLALLIPNFD